MERDEVRGEGLAGAQGVLDLSERREGLHPGEARAVRGEETLERFDVLPGRDAPSASGQRQLAEQSHLESEAVLRGVVGKVEQRGLVRQRPRCDRRGGLDVCDAQLVEQRPRPERLEPRHRSLGRRVGAQRLDHQRGEQLLT